MKEIPLTQGKVALVDDEDFSRVSALKWYAWRGQDGNWYARASANSKYMHRFVRADIRGMVDHRDGNGLNNQKQNLREATDSQNQANRRKRRPTSSQFKGVNWHEGTQKWRAQIKLLGKSRHLGLFLTESGAARAYNDAARLIFGEFASLNPA